MVGWSVVERRIEREVMALASDLVAVRREIHRRPELAGDERLTAALVERELRAAGLDVSVGVGGHGVVGLLEGRRGGPTLAYRWTRRLADLLASGAVGSLAGASIQGQLGMSAKLLGLIYRAEVAWGQSVMTVAAILRRADRVLLVRETRAEIEVWGPPGGVVEPGELLTEAVVREVNEETGLLVERIGPLGRSPGWSR